MTEYGRWWWSWEKVETIVSRKFRTLVSSIAHHVTAQPLSIEAITLYPRKEEPYWSREFWEGWMGWRREAGDVETNESWDRGVFWRGCSVWGVGNKGSYIKAVLDGLTGRKGYLRVVSGWADRFLNSPVTIFSQNLLFWALSGTEVHFVVFKYASLCTMHLVTSGNHHPPICLIVSRSQKRLR